jgi:hypothetical protein
MVRERERERGAGGRSKEMKKSTVYLWVSGNDYINVQLYLVVHTYLFLTRLLDFTYEFITSGSWVRIVTGSSSGGERAVFGTHLHMQRASWGLSSGLKQAGLEANYSQSSTAEVEYSWRFTSTMSRLNGSVFNKTQTQFNLLTYGLCCM